MGLKKSSTHQFIVPETSVFRLHLESGKSGVLIRYQVMNDEGKVLISSDSAG